MINYTSHRHTLVQGAKNIQHAKEAGLYSGQIGDQKIAIPQEPKGCESSKAKFNWLLPTPRAKQTFAVTHQVQEFVKRDDVWRECIFALKHDLFQLPSDPCLIEFNIPVIGEPGSRAEVIIEYSHGWPDGNYFIANIFAVVRHKGRTSNMASETATIEGLKMLLVDKDSEDMTVQFILPDGTNNDDSKEVNLCAKAAMNGLLYLCAFYSIKGFESEPSNIHKGQMKKAVAQGTVRPTSVNVIKIGRITTSDGREVSAAGISTVAMHLRCAHTRRQHYGPGNKMTKIIKIPATIVNFKAGEHVPERINIGVVQ